MGAPQTPPLKTHLMSFTSKGAIFREVKISKIRARHATRNLAFVNSISGHHRLRWSVRPGSGPPKTYLYEPPLPRSREASRESVDGMVDGVGMVVGARLGGPDCNDLKLR